MLQYDDILRDVRDDATRMEIVDRETWENDPKSRCEFYWKRKRFAHIDAERWPLAILSYKQYGCFEFAEDKCPGKYYSDKSGKIIYAKKDGTDVTVAADLLTGANVIVELEDIFRDELDVNDEKILRAFYMVAYTIGNFCVIWKNPSGNPKGIDNAWRKLKKGLFNDKDELNESGTYLEKRVSRWKTEEELFGIFMEPHSAKEIINMLYFQDYFNDEGNLKKVYCNLIKEIKDKDTFITTVKELTVLIIQRGYRIVNKYQKKNFDEKQQKELNKLFDEVGLL